MALEALLVPAFFLALTAAFLIHIGFDPSHQFLGDVNTVVDWNGHFWKMWDHYQALLGNEGFSHSSFVFHPYGVPNLTLHGDLAVTWLAGFLALFTGIDQAHLMVVLFVVLGNAGGGYLLVRLRTKSIPAGLVAGLVLGFNGMVAWSINTGNLEQGLWLWTCLYLYSFLRILERGPALHVGLAALFASLAIYSNFVTAILLPIFSLTLSLFYHRRLDRPRALMLSVHVALIALFLSPLLLGFLSENSQREYWPMNYKRACEGSMPASPDIQPYEDSLPLIDYLPWDQRGEGRDRTNTWFTILGLAFFAIFRQRERALKWLAATAVFFVLSLGPYLKVLYMRASEGGPLLDIPLPYLLLSRVLPLFYRIQFPSRLFGFSILALGTMAGLGVLSLMRVRRAALRHTLVAVVLALVVFELLSSWQLRSSEKPRMHPFYQQISASSEDFALIEVPFNFTTLDAQYLFFQTRHEKPLFNGLLPPFFFQDPTGGIAGGNRFIRRIEELQETFLDTQSGRVAPLMIPMPEFPHQASMAEAVRDLRAEGFRYLLLHKRINHYGLVIELDAPALQEFLNSMIGPPLMEDEDLAVYGVK